MRTRRHSTAAALAVRPGRPTTWHPTLVEFNKEYATVLSLASVVGALQAALRTRRRRLSEQLR